MRNWAGEYHIAQFSELSLAVYWAGRQASSMSAVK